MKLTKQQIDMVIDQLEISKVNLMHYVTINKNPEITDKDIRVEMQRILVASNCN